MPRKKNIGSSLDDFLHEEGIYEEANNVAIKRVLAYQLQQLMEKENLTKAEFAERMETSRSSLDRLLDPDNESVTFCLLYTSPSPRDRTRSRMPSSA